MPFVVTSCAFKIHRVSGPARGKPVLISILFAFSLMFHAITTFFDLYSMLNTWYCLWSDWWFVK